MSEIEMPPQYAGQYDDPQDTEGHVAAAARTLAAGRVNDWLTFVLLAISEFETNANNRIEHLEYEDDAQYSFDPVISGFASAVKGFFPKVLGAVSPVSDVMDGIEASYEAKLASALAGAKLRLHDSVTALVQAAREKASLAESAIQSAMPATIENGMTWVDSVSTDPDYVSALCEWIGFLQPTRENTVDPVRQSLENPFFGVYQGVRAQLFRTEGVPGLDDDDLSPVRWEHEAVVSQAQLYSQQGEAAWNKIYEGVLPQT